MRKIKKKYMNETHYRSSRICRVLGNPTAYKIIKLLEKRALTPSEIAVKLNLAVTTISQTLRILRKIDLVRYETYNREKLYFLKHRKISKILKELEAFVDTIRNIKS